jgi:hypothetical protein
MLSSASLDILKEATHCANGINRSKYGTVIEFFNFVSYDMAVARNLAAAVRATLTSITR